jgi:hypothetical protein
LPAAIRGWRLAGLFSLAAGGTFGLSIYLAIIAGPFFRHDLAPLAAPLGLTYAWMVAAFQRADDLPSLIPIAALGTLNVASFLLANRVWHDWLDEQSRPSPFIPLILLGIALLLARLALAWLMRPVRSSFGRVS